MARAGEALIDEPLAAAGGGVVVNEVVADEGVGKELVAAGAAFTLLFTKRCSLAS
jgi:hypothetical protein